MAEAWSLSENALAALRARYLRRDEIGHIVETPEQLFRRVADYVAAAELRYGRSSDEVRAVADEFCGLMARGELLPNSPTLMNAGRNLSVLSACFVLPVPDSVEEIFDSVKYTALIQKAGGGTGFSFDRLRPAGDVISTSGGQTSGPISFWRVFCEATRAIQQGAFRRGANMGMMSIEHPDILKFITAKNDPAAFENFNISVKVHASFMEGLRKEPGAPHVVVNPRTGRRYWLPRALKIGTYLLSDLPVAGSGAPGVEVYTRKQLWDLIVHNAWATGEPGVCFIDRVNEDNPTPALGRIEATNPCGEQPLLDYEACNLGSIDLAKCLTQGPAGKGRRDLDEGVLRRRIRLGVRMLDDIIDVNNYVTPPIEQRCKGNRKIGLGVMGLADSLFELGIKYDSEEGLSFGRRVARILAEEATASGEELARQRDSFPNWAGSLWDTRHHRPMRNAALTTVAPTGTLSILAGCSGGIEPAYALAFYRHILEGRELLEASAPFRRYAQRQGFWSDDLARKLAGGARLRDLRGEDRQACDLFVTAHEVAPPWHVRMQAAFQESIDGAISKTINLPPSATVADVEAVYRLAYDLRCKGVTVYRDGCRAGQPMTLEGGHSPCPQCRLPLADAPACSRCPHCGATICG
jgi:ribonucleoside-diphosphate reductase alpha chain